ncbi:unnamed protein product, partial [Ectocarpus sp. 12 AP-2014]
MSETDDATPAVEPPGGAAAPAATAGAAASSPRGGRGQPGIQGFMSAGAAAGEQARRNTTNPQTTFLTFPDDVPESIKTAIINYQPPPQREIAPLDGVRTTRSTTAFYGVKLDILPRVGEGRRKMEWACLASEVCRNSRKTLKIFSDQTSGVTSHLKDIHDIVGAASAKTVKSRKYDQLAAKGETLGSAVYKDDPSRYN